MRKQLTEWEKIFANCTSGEGLLSKKYKGLNRRTNIQIKKWTEALNKHFSKEDTQDSQ